MGTTIMIGAGLALLFYMWRNGEVTLPLNGYQSLIDEILTAARTDLYEIEEGQEKIGQRPGLHVQWGFSSILAQLLDAHQFPKARIYDLKKKILGFIKMDPALRNTRVPSDVERSFEFVTTYYDDKNKSWQKVE
ncbi:hypothetical protein [Mesorhizobium sp.]|uniref:hypothetical protein n=1 Tax=Mesorhizobium sp. TaxID=1871066 RepID=UPI000FE69925|nr:hypothetical protein [Mesorhizobium sp.]RWF67307.1 MAG: hypothetical protein EOS47_02270 [Mesorhizobium sp.]TIT41470.1 MAG: hypothetical protein E5W76_13780 [Mesorhizobium sp.]